jgi:DUF4097 and DUF4098 domain-containing protein YvlB
MKAIRSTLGLAILATLAQSAGAGEAISETRDVGPNAVISIDLTNGDVSIAGWDEQRFSIEGELSDAAEGFTLLDSNGNIRFEEHVERKNRWFWGDGRRNSGDGATLDIRIPRHSVLRLEGINANMDVRGLSGNTDVEVINGRIVANDLDGVVRLETVNGSIDTQNLSGRISLKTVNGSIDDRGSVSSRASFSAVNGSIRSDNQSPQVSASNVNGNMELDLHYVDDLEVSTVGGSLEIFAFMNDLAYIDLSSVGGSIDLRLPDTTSTSFHVSTAVGGRIRNQLSDDEPMQRNRYINSRELDFVINGGNGDVNISTVSGNITLHPCSADKC